MRTSAVLLSIALGLAACYKPDLSQVHYICEEKNPICPEGLQCVDGYCGGPVRFVEAKDLASPAVNMSTPDLAGLPPDLLYAWDPLAKPTFVAGCKSGKGYPLISNAVACPAVLTSVNDIYSQCANGYSLCSLAPLPDAACAAVPWGFFVSMATGWQSGPLPPADPSLYCGSWRSNQPAAGGRGIYGCGTAAGVASAAAPCAGFSQVITCLNGSTSSSFACPLVAAQASPTDFSVVTNSDTRNGVLCCR